MPDKPEFVRFNTIKNYIKEKEDLRSNDTAVNNLIERFNDLIEIVISRAATLARDHRRKTILVEDMKEALEKTVGKQHSDWKEVLTEIIEQNPIELGNISKGINKYIEEHQKWIPKTLQKFYPTNTFSPKTSPIKS